MKEQLAGEWRGGLPELPAVLCGLAWPLGDADPAGVIAVVAGNEVTAGAARRAAGAVGDGALASHRPVELRFWDGVIPAPLNSAPVTKPRKDQDSHLGKRSRRSHRPIPYASPHCRTRAPFRRPGRNAATRGTCRIGRVTMQRRALRACGPETGRYKCRHRSRPTVVAGVSIRRSLEPIYEKPWQIRARAWLTCS